jgi:hypothetical protein
VTLLIICFTLFRPHFWMDMIAPPFVSLPATDVAKVIEATPGGGTLRIKVDTTDIAGDPVAKAVRLKLGSKGDGRVRLAESGITLTAPSDPVVASVRPGSEAARLKLRPGDRITSVNVPNERPSPFLFSIPALIVLAGLAYMQRRRREARPLPAAQTL